MKDEKKISFFLLCLANLAISFNFAALAAVVPAMSRDFALPAVDVARILHYYMIPYGLGALLYAPLAKRFSYKTILSVTMLVYALSNGVCALTKSLSMMLAMRILMGVAAASVIPLTLMVIGQFFEKEVRGRMVGMFFSSSFVASLLGIALSGVEDWPWLYAVPAMMALVAAGSFVFYPSSILGAKEQSMLDYGRLANNARLREIFIFIFLISFAYHGVQKWFGVYLDKVYGLPQWQISFYFMLIALSGAIGQNIGGYLTDKKGRLFSTRWGVLVLSLATMALAIKFSLWLLGLVFCFFSIGWTIGHNGISTVLTDLPSDYRSEIASLNSAVRFFSGGVGFFVGGTFVESHFGLTFFAFGMMMLMSGLLIGRIVPKELVINKI